MKSRLFARGVGTVRIKLIFAWFDFWVGLFFDKGKRCLYVFPVPMFGIKIMGDAKQTCHVCGENRSIYDLAGFTRDLSSEYDLTPDTIVEKVRYCGDRQDCLSRGPEIHHIKNFKVNTGVNSDEF